MSLTHLQRQQFEESGFLVIENAFSQHDVEELRREADRLLEVVIGSSIALSQKNPRLDVRFLEGSRAMIRKVQPVTDLSLPFTRLSTDPRLIDPMAELMADDPIAMDMKEKLNYKVLVDFGDLDVSCLRSTRSGTGEAGEFLPHHDWGYYRHSGYPETAMSSAVALDDCERRGPLRVIPGSHRLDMPLRDPSGNGVVADGAFQSADLVPINLRAGSLLLFHTKLVHDSPPNRSQLPRRMMVYAHCPTSQEPRQIDLQADPTARHRPTQQAAQKMERKYQQMLGDQKTEPLRLSTISVQD